MPNVVILAGPNGAGKSTVAERVIRDLLTIREFVSAETLAVGMAGFDPESAMIPAWRHKMVRLNHPAERESDFAFETTLAGYDFAPWLRELRARPYHVELIYVWVPEVEVCVRRVVQRAKAGHQKVSEDLIRQHHGESAKNFFGVYQSLADDWRVFDNSTETGTSLIAEGHRSTAAVIHDQDAWTHFLQSAGHEHKS